MDARTIIENALPPSEDPMEAIRQAARDRVIGEKTPKPDPAWTPEQVKAYQDEYERASQENSPERIQGHALRRAAYMFSMDPRALEPGQGGAVPSDRNPWSPELRKLYRDTYDKEANAERRRRGMVSMPSGRPY